MSREYNNCSFTLALTAAPSAPRASNPSFHRPREESALPSAFSTAYCIFSVSRPARCPNHKYGGLLSPLHSAAPGRHRRASRGAAEPCRVHSTFCQNPRRSEFSCRSPAAGVVAGNLNRSARPIVSGKFPLVKIQDPLRAVAGEQAQIRVEVSHREKPSLPANLKEPRFNIAFCRNRL